MSLRNIIKSAGGSLDDWTVMSNSTDPYRLDTPANHRDAQWLADAWAACGLTQIHNRGLHYALVSTPGLVKPDGTPYSNTDDNWIFLQRISGYARWLGYIEFDAIVDERNAAPELFLPPESSDAGCGVGHTADSLLTAQPELPEVYASFPAPHARQAYKLVVIGEKASLRSLLQPICERYHAELVLPTGELSTTLLHGIAQRAANDGRPCRVFYLSDFDPSGVHMPVEVSRKFQALCHLKFHDLDLEVHRCALLTDQVKTLKLPETPLKESERRAARWRERYGCEQTEIDALATLKPAVLSRIVREALDPYFDATLQKRQRLAYQEAQSETELRIEEALDGYEESLARASTLIDVARQAQEVAASYVIPLFDEIISGIEPAEPEPVEPELDEDDFAEPMFSSLDSFEEATQALLMEKL